MARGRALNVLVQALADQARFNAIGGTVAVSAPSVPLLQASWGSDDPDTDSPVTADHGFQIGSQTKMFTAMLVLRLVARGKVDLDVPAGHYVRDLGAWSDITIAELLLHRSGLGCASALLERRERLPQRIWTFRELLLLAETQPPQFAPGFGFAYNNTGYWVLGAVIEAVTGRAFEGALDALLLRPLCLTRTCYGAGQLPTPMMRGYYRTAGTASSFETTRGGELLWGGPAGAMTSCTADLLAFASALLGQEEQLLPSLADLAARTLPTTGAAGRSHYGLGIECRPLNGHPYWGHGGSTTGYLSATLVSPQRKTRIVAGIAYRDAHDDAIVQRMMHFSHLLSSAELTLSWLELSNDG